MSHHTRPSLRVGRQAGRQADQKARHLFRGVLLLFSQRDSVYLSSLQSCLVGSTPLCCWPESRDDLFVCFFVCQCAAQHATSGAADVFVCGASLEEECGC